MPPPRRRPSPLAGLLSAAFYALSPPVAAQAQGAPAATPLGPSSARQPPAPEPPATDRALAPSAAGPAPAPSPSAAGRSGPPGFGRLTAYAGATRVEAGPGALVFAPLGAELALGGGGREEIALGVEGAPAFGCGRCGGVRARFGAALRFHLAPRGRVDPWVGALAGGQLLSLPGLAGTPAPLFGFYKTLQLGVDFGLSPGLRAGAFVTGALQGYRPLDKNGIDPKWSADASPLELGGGLRLRFAL